jgi:hypothetical protein
MSREESITSLRPTWLYDTAELAGALEAPTGGPHVVKPENIDGRANPP